MHAIRRRGDNSQLAVRYRIEFEESREVPRTIEELHFEYHELEVRAMQGGGLTHSEFHDENPGDNAIVFFSDLRDGQEVVAPGLWDLRFEINYPENGRTLDIDGSTGTTQVSVFPIALSWDFVEREVTVCDTSELFNEIIVPADAVAAYPGEVGPPPAGEGVGPAV